MILKGLIHNNIKIKRETAFVSLTLFNIIRIPLMVFPETIGQLIQVNISEYSFKNYKLYLLHYFEPKGRCLND